MSDNRKSLEEQLGEVYDKVQSGAPVETAPETTPEPETTTTATERDEQGKFKAKSDEQAAETAPPLDEPKKDTGKDDEAGSKPSTVEATVTAIAAPVSLPEAAKAEWSKTPPAIQQAMLKRENDIARYVQQTSGQIKAFEAINQQIEPMRKELESFYGDVPTALKTLFSISDYATKSPYEYVRWFAQQRGLDAQQIMNVFAGGHAPASAQPAYNPQIAALSQEVMQLKEHRQQQEQQRTAAEDAAAAKAISEFIANPANKYQEQVREDMAALLSAGLAQDLQDAYDQAIWRRPDLRQSMLAEQAAQAEAKRKADADKLAKQAKTASVIAVATKGGAHGSPKQAQTVDEVLSATYDRLHGAV